MKTKQLFHLHTEVSEFNVKNFSVSYSNNIDEMWSVLTMRLLRQNICFLSTIICLMHRIPSGIFP